MITYIILVVLHVSLAAVTMGASIGGASGCRRALAQGQSVFLHAARETVRKAMIAGICAVLTFGIGVALIMYRGGFGAVTPNFHAAMTAMLVLIGIIFAMVVPAAKKAEAIAEKAPFVEAEARSSIGRIGMSTGIVHGLWTVILFLMYFSW